jgi:hypothetical protein
VIDVVLGPCAGVPCVRAIRAPRILTNPIPAAFAVALLAPVSRRREVAGTFPMARVAPTTSVRESLVAGSPPQCRSVWAAKVLVGLDDLFAVVEAAVAAHAMRELDLVALWAGRLRGRLKNVRGAA